MANIAKTLKAAQKKVDHSVRSLGFSRKDIKRFHAFEHEVAVNTASTLLVSAIEEAAASVTAIAVVGGKAATAKVKKLISSKKAINEKEEIDDEVEVVDEDCCEE